MGECLISRRGGGGDGAVYGTARSYSTSNYETMTLPEQFAGRKSIYIMLPVMSSSQQGAHMTNMHIVDGVPQSVMTYGDNKVAVSTGAEKYYRYNAETRTISAYKDDFYFDMDKGYIVFSAE